MSDNDYEQYSRVVYCLTSSIVVSSSYMVLLFILGILYFIELCIMEKHVKLAASTSSDAMLKVLKDQLDKLMGQMSNQAECIQSQSETQAANNKTVNESIKNIGTRLDSQAGSIKSIGANLETQKNSMTTSIQGIKDSLSVQCNNLNTFGNRFEAQTEQIDTISKSISADLKTQSTNIQHIKEDMLTNTQVLRQDIDTITKNIQKDVAEQIQTISTKFNSRCVELQQRIDANKVSLQEFVKQEIKVSESTINVNIDSRIKLVADKINNDVLEKLSDTEVVLKVGGQISNKIDPILERLTVVEDKIESGVTVTDHRSSTVVNGARVVEATLPKFSGNDKSSPRHFINELDRYFLLNGTLSRLKLEIVPMALEKEAKVWHQAFSHQFHDYNEFKRLFINKYLSEDTETELREALHRTTFNPNSGCSYTQHYLQQMVKNSELLIPYGEEQLVKIVMRHYDINVRHILVARNVRTSIDMEHVLQTLDWAGRPSSKKESRIIAKQTKSEGHPKDSTMGTKSKNTSQLKTGQYSKQDEGDKRFAQSNVTAKPAKQSRNKSDGINKDL